MDSLIEATEVQIERDVQGVKRVFKFIDAYDRAEILRAYLDRRKQEHAERKAKRIENLKLAGIDGEKMYVELEQFDDEAPKAEDLTEADFAKVVNNPLCSMDIFRASLAKTYPDNAAEIAKVVVLTLTDKAKICGLGVIEKPVVGDTENPPMAPAIPPTFSTPEPTSETGSQTAAA